MMNTNNYQMNIEIKYCFSKNYQGDIIVEIREIVIGNLSFLISYITRNVFVDVIL